MRKYLTLIVLAGISWSQEASTQGKEIFQQRCAACHKVEQKLIGPPLARIQERRSKEWFVRFVSNSQALIQSGDAQAVAVYKEYNQQVMPPFPDLSSAHLEALWAYLNAVEKPQAASTASAEPSSVEGSAVAYPGQTRPMRKEEFAFLRQTFWGLVGAAVLVSLLLGVIIHFVSERRAAGDAS
jgi:mono/diheme cytochrome c family protein